MNDCDKVKNCVGRREFLVKSGLVAGGLVLTLSAPLAGFATPFDDIVIPIDDKSPLNKVGGSTTIDSPKGEIVIVRTGDAAFAAVSAKCTHQGGPVGYDEEKKQFACPWHGSKFGTDGSNVKGPAKTPLTVYTATGSSTSVTVKVS